MDFRVKSNGKIQAVAEDGTPLGGEFTFHYTFFRAYEEDGNTLLSKLPGEAPIAPNNAMHSQSGNEDTAETLTCIPVLKYCCAAKRPF